MTTIRNDFSIYKNEDDCRLGVGHDWLTYINKSDWGDREGYTFNDERGIIYKVNYYKKDNTFGELSIDGSNYLGGERKLFSIPRNRQFIIR